MSFKVENNRVSYYLDGKEVAYSTFPLVEGRENLININSTFVDVSLRGQGIAEKLMEHIAEEARTQKWKIVPSCSYAVKWFKKHKEHHDLLVAPLM